MDNLRVLLLEDMKERLQKPLLRHMIDMG